MEILYSFHLYSCSAWSTNTGTITCSTAEFLKCHKKDEQKIPVKRFQRKELKINKLEQKGAGCSNTSVLYRIAAITI